MLLPLAKFIIFTLAHTLFLIWSISPELWSQIFSSVYLVGKNPCQLLYFLDNLPEKANSLLSTGENLVQSLTCDNIEFALPTEVLASHQYEDTHMPTLVELKDLSPPFSMPLTPGVAPKYTFWRIAGVRSQGPLTLNH
ncbi:hypothetical protein DSO57_1013831 [Entomophthora muscae]|uniref:Uncharacterized protein n=1 Tax=Entomophthora muscae TaxID=34485 RepID=A0ACC2SIH0_9FUNG|nr:hypothetical protein DSO57_1013831 [Entomophthora muscae]